MSTVDHKVLQHFVAIINEIIRLKLIFQLLVYKSKRCVTHIGN